jgi:hypothetical protein
MINKIIYTFFLLLIFISLSYAWNCKDISVEEFWDYKDPEYIIPFGGGDLISVFGAKYSEEGEEILVKDNYAVGNILLKKNFVFKSKLGFYIKNRAIVGILYSSGKPFILVGVFKTGVAVKNCFYQGSKFKCKTLFFKNLKLDEGENKIIISFKPIKKSNSSILSVSINNKTLYTKEMLSSDKVYFKPFMKVVYSKIYIYSIKVCADKIISSNK